MASLSADLPSQRRLAESLWIFWIVGTRTSRVGFPRERLFMAGPLPDFSVRLSKRNWKAPASRHALRLSGPFRSLCVFTPSASIASRSWSVVALDSGAAGAPDDSRSRRLRPAHDFSGQSAHG